MYLCSATRPINPTSYYGLMLEHAAAGSLDLDDLTNNF